MTSDAYAPFTDPAVPLREALQRIASLHCPVGLVRGNGSYCRECEALWPCMTYRIAEDAQP